MEARRRLYALAGAMSVETAELLRSLHRAVGGPADVEEMPPRRRTLLPAAVRTYGAAAACSALAARLLLTERAVAAAGLADPAPPPVAERGVTVLEENDLAAWRATVRATAAAAAEINAAGKLWQAAGEFASDEVLDALSRLADYADELSQILERSEPAA
jgi:uncharacterized protein YhdP